ncbi:hypothetical protein TM7_0636 [candidate division TM7 genomosp. GTL1]|nr:hypothetical protein TM7_0636 [candidate division TM7 genomosp. GTL1]
MSQRFDDMMKRATAVRDHYTELQVKNGHATWAPKDRMAGFVADVGDLSKLIMVKNGLRSGPEAIDSKLAHELSDCLWSVMVLADELGVDLENAFNRTMDELHERIEKEKANS